MPESAGLLPPLPTGDSLRVGWGVLCDKITQVVEKLNKMDIMELKWAPAV